MNIGQLLIGRYVFGPFKKEATGLRPDQTFDFRRGCVAQKTYQAGVKDYAKTYWTPNYVPLDSDLLAVFKVVPQEGVPFEEAAAAVAAESSTGTWTTVWTDLLTDLEYYKGRAYRIETLKKNTESLDILGVYLASNYRNSH